MENSTHVDDPFNHYWDFIDRQCKGSFGTLMLQVPVENGFSGGKLYLQNGSLTSKHLMTQNSHRSFHMSVFHDDCDIVTESLETGNRLEFIFKLCNKNAISCSEIAPVLKDDPKSPLYRMWQPPPNVNTGAVIETSAKQKRFQDLFSSWKNVDHSEAQLYVIPLEHSYRRKSLSPNMLKGTDRSIADIILSLLGDVAEVHFATVTEYDGFNEDDAATQFNFFTMTNKMLNEVQEKLQYTQYYAGNWTNLNNLHLNLPPVRITVPDELVGLKGDCFKVNPLDPSSWGDDTCVDRAAIILWPRSKSFEIALRFGLDQALDVVERSSQMECSVETRMHQMQCLLDYCQKFPHESWFANHQVNCKDYRCDQARNVSLPVASLRALRLINLCLLWNLTDCGLKLIRLLFSNFKLIFYRCYNCRNFYYSDPPFFVGGVPSNSVASALADLIVMIDWESAGINNYIKGLHSNKNFVKQAGSLAHLAICLFHKQCFAGAQYISEVAYTILITKNLYKLDAYTSFSETETKRSTLKETVALVMDMLLLIDGVSFSEQSRFNQLQLKLKSLNLEATR